MVNGRWVIKIEIVDLPNVLLQLCVIILPPLAYCICIIINLKYLNTHKTLLGTGKYRYCNYEYHTRVLGG